MIKIFSAIAACVILAGTAFGQSSDFLPVTVTTNTVDAATNSVNGFIDSIILDLIGSAPTASVAVVVVPSVSTGPEVVLYTNAAIAADTVVRPRFAATDTTGAAIAGETNLRFAATGEDIEVRVSGENAGTTNVNVTIKYQR